MKKPEIPLYHVERRDYINADGQLQSIVHEHWRQSERNIDTFQVQEAFLATISSQIFPQNNQMDNKTTLLL